LRREAKISVRAYSLSHPDLGTASPEQARTEIFASRRNIEDRLGQRCCWFAYPFGGRRHFRPEWLPLIREAGYEGAVSAFGGFVTPHSDDLMLPREAIPYFKSALHLEMHLSGCLHWLYGLRGRLDRPDGEDPAAFLGVRA